jgi:nucleotide-binding universal stress UspA family protein
VAVFAAVRLGAVAEQILAYANEHQIDLVIIGLRKHNAVTRALRGSTVDRIVRRATCPVLTLPAADRAQGTHAPQALEAAS